MAISAWVFFVCVFLVSFLSFFFFWQPFFRPVLERPTEHEKSNKHSNLTPPHTTYTHTLTHTHTHSQTHTHTPHHTPHTHTHTHHSPTQTTLHTHKTHRQTTHLTHTHRPHHNPHTHTHDTHNPLPHTTLSSTPYTPPLQQVMFSNGGKHSEDSSRNLCVLVDVCVCATVCSTRDKDNKPRRPHVAPLVTIARDQCVGQNHKPKARNPEPAKSTSFSTPVISPPKPLTHKRSVGPKAHQVD